MDSVALLKEILIALKFELIRYRSAVVVIAITVLFLVIGIGLTWNNSFVSKATLEIDDSNIIQPLLAGKAEFSEVDRVDEATKSIRSKEFLEIVAKKLGYIDENTSPEQTSGILKAIRSSIMIESEGRRSKVFTVSFFSSNPDIAFETASVISEEFVTYAQKTQRLEGEYAYDFITRQANQYKTRLEKAEQALQEFKAESLDTNERTVQGRIAELESEIQNITLGIQDSESNITELTNQLSSEGKFLEAQARSYSLRKQKLALENQLAQLRTQFQDSYPDIVSLQQQIGDLDAQIEQIEGEDSLVNVRISGLNGEVANPEMLFDDLRSQLSNAQVGLKTQTRRLQSLKSLLDGEKEKADILAANQSKAADLMRDYTVNKNLYEDFLGRKESAELSVAITRDGRGLTFRVVSEPAYPFEPSGLTWKHFFLSAPILAIGVPIGFLLGLIILDPRIRTETVLKGIKGDEINFLGAAHHYHTAFSQRVFKKDIVILSGASAVAISVYMALLMMNLSW